MRCSDCGAEVSVLREYCANCGAPTDPSPRDRLRQPGHDGRQPGDERLRRNRRALIVATAVVLGFGIVGNSWWRWDFGADSANLPGMIDQDRPRGAVTIDAVDLYQAYRDNPAASEERFAGREMVVSGEFLRIVPDGYGSLDMRLKTSNPEAELGVDLAQLAVEDGKGLLPGQRVTVSCQQMGEGGDKMWLRDCAIQPTPEEGGASKGSDPADPAAPAARQSS